LGDFFDGNKLYISHLKGCQTAWKVHNMTWDKQNTSRVAIMVSNARYSASSSSVSTNWFMEHMYSPYKLKNAKQNIEWKTHFLEDGIIVKFHWKSLTVGVLMAITNSSCL
jgi:hypothetical protein